MKIIGAKLVYNAKPNADGTVARFKARVVARGDMQQHDDLMETFAPTASYATVRTMVAASAAYKWHMHAMDVSAAYLHADLKNPVYMYPPPLYGAEKGHVLKLRKSLYGLKEAGREWGLYLRGVLTRLGWKPCAADPCVYTMGRKGDRLIMCTYVDDLLIMGESEEAIEKAKKGISTATVPAGSDKRYQGAKPALEIKDLGVATGFLNMVFTHLPNGRLHVSQLGYTRELTRKWKTDGKPCRVPMAEQPAPASCEADALNADQVLEYQRLLGALNHLAVVTRPDIAFAVGVAARRAACPSQGDRSALNCILRYLTATPDHGVTYGPTMRQNLGATCYVDASLGDDKHTRRSTSGMVYMLGGGPICWASRRQAWVAMSTCEAEINAMTEGVKESMWVRTMLNDLLDWTGTSAEMGQTTMLVDNQASIAILGREAMRRNVRHLAVRVAFIREEATRSVAIEYVPSTENLADGLTKPLGAVAHASCFNAMGIKPLDEATAYHSYVARKLKGKKQTVDGIDVGGV